jgi:hypothetical protein
MKIDKKITFHTIKKERKKERKKESGLPTITSLRSAKTSQNASYNF